ncbi:MAG: hypothetical protein AB7Q23_12205 [Hyphomonadaceae bacterium]
MTDTNYEGINGGAGSAGNGDVEVAASTVAGYFAAGGESALNYLVLHETGHNSRGGRSFFGTQFRAFTRRTGSRDGFYGVGSGGGPSPEAIANEQYANSFAQAVGSALGVPVFEQELGTLP